MIAAVEAALPLVACLAAFATGACAAMRAGDARRCAARRRARLGAAEGEGALAADGLDALVLGVASRLDASASRSPRRSEDAATSSPGGGRVERLIRQAGLAGELGRKGVDAARVRLGLAVGAVGAVLGCVLSAEAALALGVVGAAAGASAPTRALRCLRDRRALEHERGLPEMLEVVALGVRSGLSFDRSFQLYADHFPSTFALACRSAQRSWSLGLLTRDDALRGLAESYDSDQLARAVGRIVRSLRFGSSLAPDLEAAAAEARARRRAKVEERVAKAPVKMMVPTGTFILPAMLLLVLGPILLELMQG